jgi:hypothetical protein
MSDTKPFNSVIDDQINDKTNLIKSSKPSKPSKTVHFSDKIQTDDISMDTYIKDVIKESDTISHMIIDKDPTDIYDDDEQEILDEDQDDFISKDIDIKYFSTIKYIYNMFMTKYSHLDNFKNKEIVYEICKITVRQMPEHVSNPKYYLNFIEDSIKQINSNSNDGLENDELE